MQRWLYLLRVDFPQLPEMLREQFNRIVHIKKILGENRDCLSVSAFSLISAVVEAEQRWDVQQEQKNEPPKNCRK
jgi:hypothetical protein